MKSNRSMLRNLLSGVALCCAGLFSADAFAQETPPAPTREACDAAYSSCFTDNGFFGFFICPGQYNQCLSQVEGAGTNESVSKLTACRDAAATCRTDAGEDQEKLAACSQTQRACVSGALGVDPQASEKARACFETVQQCVQGAEGNDGVSKCFSDLQTCLVPPTEPKTPG